MIITFLENFLFYLMLEVMISLIFLMAQLNLLHPLLPRPMALLFLILPSLYGHDKINYSLLGFSAQFPNLLSHKWSIVLLLQTSDMSCTCDTLLNLKLELWILSFNFSLFRKGIFLCNSILIKSALSPIVSD